MRSWNLKIIFIVIALFIPAATDAQVGVANVTIFDDFDNETTSTLKEVVLPNGKTITLPENANVNAGDKIRVNNKDSFEILEQSLSIQSEIVEVRKVAVSLVSVYPRNPTMPWTIEQVQATMNNLSEWYNSTSYGKVRLDITIFPWISYIHPDSAKCPFTNIHSFALQTNNIDDEWDHRITIFPKLPCGFSGAASYGGREVYLNGTISHKVSGHEIGHNLRLHHANALKCNPDCIQVTYGDRYDIMGNSLHHFGANNKRFIEYLDVDYQPYTQEIQDSGVYTISKYETLDTTYPKAIRYFVGDIQYVIETRGNGVVVRIHYNQTILNGTLSNFLLDLDFTDTFKPLLKLNEVFTNSDIYIKVISVNKTNITVEINAQSI